MKYKKVVPLTALLFILGTMPALAVETTPTPLRLQLKQNRVEYHQQVKEEFKETREVLKPTLTEVKTEYKTNRQNLITQAQKSITDRLFATIKTRLENRFKFLEDSKVKVQTRINEKIQAGKDMASAQEKINLITPLESQYQTKFTELQNAYNQAVASTKPLQNLPAVRKIANDAWKILGQIKNLETDAVKLIIKSGK